MIPNFLFQFQTALLKMPIKFHSFFLLLFLQIIYKRLKSILFNLFKNRVHFNSSRFSYQTKTTALNPQGSITYCTFLFTTPFDQKLQNWEEIYCLIQKKILCKISKLKPLINKTWYNASICPHTLNYHIPVPVCL